jgi:hypothetical protein
MKKLILLLPILLLAYIHVNVNKKTVYPGEEVVFTIEATGNDIKFPNIKDIEGFPVQGTAITQNITILNGNMQKSVSKSYIFFPTKNVTIPSFSVIVDSKTYKTKPIKITVTKPKESKNDNFKIKLSSDKKKVYIGEPVIFNIKFFQKEGTSPQSIEIQKPNFNDFFSKQISKKEYQKNGYSITEYSFLLIPQKAGNYKIGPILAKIGYLSKDTPFNDPFFNLVTASLKYTNIFSNEVDINVSAIPQNSVYGQFKASLSADKTETDANEPVKITLKINGCGDFYDLPDFKLNIPKATVYENSPKINTFIKNSKLCGSYTKEFTVISNQNLSIPSIEFKSFDGKIHSVKTNSLFITVHNKNSTKKTSPFITAKNITPKVVYKTKTNYILLLLVFATGIIVGVLITYLLKLKLPQNDEIISKIKKADEKELFNILLEYSYIPEIEKTLKALEENIYCNKQNKINKKEIIKIIKKLKKS